MEKNAGCREKAGIATLHSASGNGADARRAGNQSCFRGFPTTEASPPQAARIDPRKGAEGSGFFGRATSLARIATLAPSIKIVALYGLCVGVHYRKGVVSLLVTPTERPKFVDGAAANAVLGLTIASTRGL
jgi:hypothetical protein